MMIKNLIHISYIFTWYTNNNDGSKYKENLVEKLGRNTVCQSRNTV